MSLTYKFAGDALYLISDIEQYIDAATFEARVAEKLAHTICYVGPCPKPVMTCSACRLKEARLMVEEEMD